MLITPQKPKLNIRLNELKGLKGFRKKITSIKELPNGQFVMKMIQWIGCLNVFADHKKKL
jgi:hypothetical protein